MRNAREFVEEYRRKGYPDDRIRIIASMRPEPLRSEALKILNESQEAVSAPEPAQVEIKEEAPTVSTRKELKSLSLEQSSSSPEDDVQTVTVVKDDAELHSLRAELADVIKEREEVASLLKRTAAEVERLRNENAEATALRARIAELESVHKELDETRSQRQEVTAAKADLEGKISDLKAKLKQKEALLVEKDKILKEMEQAVQREREVREERESEVARAESEISSLKTDITSLRHAEQAKSRKISEMEEAVSGAREEADALRRQMSSNEQAVADIQEKLSARESELESLREHFDREAKDLNKRAEQELWLIQRRLRRVHRLAGVGAAIAACLVIAAVFAFAREAMKVSSLENQLATGRPLESRQVDVARTLSGQSGQAQARQTASAQEPRSGLLNVQNPTQNPSRTTAPNSVSAPIPVVPTETSLAPRTRVITYTVEKNDTLWIISQKLLGKGERWKEIAKENGISLTNGVIHPGMKLKVTITEPN